MACFRISESRISDSRMKKRTSEVREGSHPRFLFARLACVVFSRATLTESLHSLEQTIAKSYYNTINNTAVYINILYVHPVECHHIKDI